MRTASSIIAFIFLGVAAAGVVPDIAGRNVARADGNGGNNTSMSGVPSHTHSSVSHTAIWNGTRSTASGPPHSGSYNGTSYHPTSRASHTGTFTPTGVPTHTSGLPSDMSVPSEPTATKA